MEKYPQKRSLDWCQKNYFSASAGAKDRQSSAKHCDTQARQSYIAAPKNIEDKEHGENQYQCLVKVLQKEVETSNPVYLIGEPNLGILMLKPSSFVAIGKAQCFE